MVGVDVLVEVAATVGVEVGTETVGEAGPPHPIRIAASAASEITIRTK
jgi:hypothetical protein